jgi:hypothetical protein
MRSRLLTAALFAATLAAGCIPGGTTGWRKVGSESGLALGITVPIAITQKPWGPGPPEFPDRPWKVEWFAEVTIIGATADDARWNGTGLEREMSITEYDLGVGAGWYNAVGAIGEPGPLWYGWSAGLSFIDASTEDLPGGKDACSAWGGYVALGFFNRSWGGLMLRYTFAPDEELGGIREELGGLTITYWWGCYPAAALWQCPAWEM